MNIKSFNSLYKYMMDNNSLYNGLYPDGFTFKYMNVDIDSRTGSIWRVSFRECHNYNRDKWDDIEGKLWFRELNNKPLAKQLEEFIFDCQTYNHDFSIVELPEL